MWEKCTSESAVNFAKVLTYLKNNLDYFIVIINENCDVPTYAEYLKLLYSSFIFTTVSQGGYIFLFGDEKIKAQRISETCSRSPSNWIEHQANVKLAFGWTESNGSWFSLLPMTQSTNCNVLQCFVSEQIPSPNSLAKK